MTEPVAEAARPPADLDARYQPFGSFDQWQQPAVELRLVDQAAAELDRECRDADPASVRAALDFAVRAAAFDTGAIEGLYETDRGVTFAVAAQTAAWETAVAEASGPAAVRHFEAQLRAFELVFDAATGHTPVTAAWLRALHDTICAGQPSYRALTPVGWQDLPLPRGAYKKLPNHVRQPDGSWHSYAPVDQVGPEVQRLVDEVGSPEFAAAHPVVQAAYVHHALVSVHPFADGNGRVARTAASVFLCRATRVPLLVFADQRLRYLMALRSADRGDAAAVIRFVRDVVLDTIELVIQALRAARAEASLEQLAAPRDPEGADPDQGQVRFAASRLHTAVRDELADAASDLTEERVTVQISPGQSVADHGFPPPVSVVATGGREGAYITTTVGVSEELAGDWPLRVVAEGPQHQPTVAPMRLRLDSLYPVLTSVTRHRIREWARQLVSTLATELLSGSTGPLGNRHQAA